MTIRGMLGSRGCPQHGNVSICSSSVDPARSPPMNIGLGSGAPTSLRATKNPRVHISFCRRVLRSMIRLVIVPPALQRISSLVAGANLHTAPRPGHPKREAEVVAVGERSGRCLSSVRMRSISASLKR